MGNSFVKLPVYTALPEKGYVLCANLRLCQPNTAYEQTTWGFPRKRVRELAKANSLRAHGKRNIKQYPYDRGIVSKTQKFYVLYSAREIYEFLL